MPSPRTAAMVILALIVIAVTVAFLAAASLFGQAAPATPAPLELRDLVPSAASAAFALASVYITGAVVKGSGRADTWWQQTVTPKLKPIQPVLAGALTIGAVMLGTHTNTGILPGASDLAHGLLEAPVATLAAIVLREGIVAGQRALEKKRQGR